MREIKFKAKRKKDNSWVFGFLTVDKNGHSRIHYCPNHFSFIVNPETVCQFTGLKDKNGVDIYEGDLFLSNENCVVFYNERNAAFEVVEYFDTGEEYSKLSDYDTNHIQVTGNIHDKNKEDEN